MRETSPRFIRLLRAIAVALHILSAIPMYLTDGSNWGLCITLAIAAVATALIVYTRKEKTKNKWSKSASPAGAG